MDVKVGDVILNASDDSSLRFYSIVTREPDSNGHWEGVQIVVDFDKRFGGLYSCSAYTSGSVKEIGKDAVLLSVPEAVNA